jgi:hypothetical protein
MSQKAMAAVSRFVEHVDQQRTMREGKENEEPTPASEAIVAERGRLMDEVVEAAGLTAKQIQTGLGVNRTTWERWRKMESIPNRTHLAHLQRLIEDHGSSLALRPSVQTLPEPLMFLSASPRTYSQLRVLFSHGDYHWKDAVFHFQKPFSDTLTVVDMASLALNGCQIVYMLKPSLLSGDDKKGWLCSFVQNMVLSLSRKVSSRALASFCFVEISDDEDKSLDQFGVLNFWSLNEGARVGYFWEGNPTDKAEDYASQARKYTPTEASDERFDSLKQQYYDSLRKAFDTIKSNTSGEVEKEFNHDKRKYPFEIPKIIAKTQRTETVTVYV